jgi:hypothetical protein
MTITLAIFRVVKSGAPQFFYPILDQETYSPAINWMPVFKPGSEKLFFRVKREISGKIPKNNRATTAKLARKK